MSKNRWMDEMMLLEAGIIPESMNWHLPEKGVVYVDPNKIDYSYNKKEGWAGLWDSALVFQFAGLESYVENWVEEKMKTARSPLEEIEYRKKIALDRIEENGEVVDKRAQAIETLRSA